MPPRTGRFAGEFVVYSYHRFEHAFRLGERRVFTGIVEQVLSRAIDEPEPTLTRNGYDTPTLIVLLQAKPAQARDVLASTLA